MKSKLVKMATASVLSLAVVVFSVPATVSAADNTYLLGNTTMTVNSDDLFGTAFKGLMPGDEKSLTINLANRSGYQQDVFLKAETTSEEEQVLIDKIEMKLRLNGALLYWGNVAGDAVNTGTSSSTGYSDMHGWMSLGRFANNASAALEVEIYVPEDLGDDYQSTLDSVDWKLNVKRISDNDDKDEKDIWSDKEITETEVPLVSIPEPQVPLTDLPKTGGALQDLFQKILNY